MVDLTNKVAVVTGAARGIGKAIAIKLAQQGAVVVLCDILDEVNDTVKEITDLGHRAKGFKKDITNFDEVEYLITETRDQFGKIDILVNNAGITRDNFLVRMSEEDWNLVIDVNLKGTFNCLKAVAKIMMKQNYGKIINISSIVGIIGNAGQANYAASKGGVISLTKSAAKELASRGVTVNAVAPGFIETDMTKSLPEKIKENFLKVIPVNKAGTPEDIANVIAFLASDEANYITGQVINVDGGMVM